MGRKPKKLPELVVTVNYNHTPEAVRYAAEAYATAVVKMLRQQNIKSNQSKVAG